MGDKIGKHKDPEFAGDSSVWTGEICEKLCQAVAGSNRWRIFVVRRSCLNRRRTHCIHHRPGIKWIEAREVPG
jgi:hypothetical protein